MEAVVAKSDGMDEDSFVSRSAVKLDAFDNEAMLDGLSAKSRAVGNTWIVEGSSFKLDEQPIGQPLSELMACMESLNKRNEPVLEELVTKSCIIDGVLLVCDSAVMAGVFGNEAMPSVLAVKFDAVNDDDMESDSVVKLVDATDKPPPHHHHQNNNNNKLTTTNQHRMSW